MKPRTLGKRPSMRCYPPQASPTATVFPRRAQSGPHQPGPLDLRGSRHLVIAATSCCGATSPGQPT